MGRIPKGAPAKGVPPKGSWGTGYTIENTYESKRISCSYCIHYCKEDKSCNKTGAYVPINGYGYWKQCTHFILSPEYEGKYKDIVISIKGKRCIYSERAEKTTKNVRNISDNTRTRTKSIQRKKEGVIPDSFYTDFLEKFGIGYNKNFYNSVQKLLKNLGYNEKNIKLNYRKVSEKISVEIIEKLTIEKNRKSEIVLTKERFTKALIEILQEEYLYKK